MADDDGDLGFTFRTRKDGAVEVRHFGALAATLRNKAADRFNQDVESMTAAQQQQLMARVTGNYKRGSESRAASHPRNQR